MLSDGPGIAHPITRFQLCLSAIKATKLPSGETSGLDELIDLGWRALTLGPLRIDSSLNDSSSLAERSHVCPFGLRDSDG